MSFDVRFSGSCVKPYSDDGELAHAPRDAVEDLHRIVTDRLETAGATLLAMPNTGFPSGFKVGWGEVVNDYREAYGWTAATVRPPVPSASAISRMDEAFAWLAFIPDGRHIVRRVVAARALVSALTWRPVFTWRRLGEKLGAHHTQVQRWHGEGISLIVGALLRENFR